MTLFGVPQASGDIVSLQRSDPRHLTPEGLTGPVDQKSSGGFPGMLLNALDGANNLEQRSLSLEQQMIIDPKSVDAHDVTIALGEANLALSMTKAIVDRVIRAYQDIINVR